MTIELRQNLKSFIGARGGTWVDLPSLLPANTLLELAGETLRPRLYFTNSPNGSELCLRADLTIPAALYYLENFASGDNYTLLCEGKVFRAPLIDDAPAEFTQIGIEKFGAENTIESDLDILLSVLGACKGAGLSDSLIRLADGNLVDLIISKADLPDIWRSFLRARTKSKNSLLSDIKAAMSHEKSSLSDLENQMLGLSDDIAQVKIRELIESSGLQSGPARSAFDIAKRIKQKAKLKSSEPLCNRFGNILIEILKIEDNAQNAIGEILGLAKAISINLTDWANTWQQRLGRIESEITNTEKVRFEAMPKARFEYYDGMIFEIAPVNNPELAVAFGGRYDGLLGALSNGTICAKAVGATIRPERLVGALNG